MKPLIILGSLPTGDSFFRALFDEAVRSGRSMGLVTVDPGTQGVDWQVVDGRLVEPGWPQRPMSREDLIEIYPYQQHLVDHLWDEEVVVTEEKNQRPGDHHKQRRGKRKRNWGSPGGIG